ncbi:acyltransferase family protein [Microvirga sp. RSM25]|uniref:acyltransferase family protein n=1 Tax=Microvirga sp. RSM25 TaxID=3273802 RepID=UPI00384EB901
MLTEIRLETKLSGGVIMSAEAQTKLVHRDNNFDFLRVTAALLVIYGHSQALLGIPYSRLWGTPISAMGVVIFFALSGYLVTESWQRDPRLRHFFLKRSLRIFPGLIVCVIATACLLGPSVTRLSLSDYFSNPHFARYFTNIVLWTRYNLPAVFENNVYKHAVNGSLWSLPAEFFCYIAVGAMGLGHRRLHPVVVSAAALAVCLTGGYLMLAYHGPQIVFYATDVAQATSVMPFFMVGAVYCALKDRIPFRLDLALVLAFSLFAIEGLGLGLALLALSWVVIPYMVLAFGTQSTPVLRRFGRFGDLSYGLYLYSFPIQQLLVYVNKTAITPGSLTISTTLLAGTCAFASWHLIEKNALRLKPSSKPVLTLVADRSNKAA